MTLEMGWKLKHFEKVIQNKSKEEVLIDVKYTLFACSNEDDQRPCGGGRPYSVNIRTTPYDYAETICKFIAQLGNNSEFIAYHVVENTIEYIHDRLNKPNHDINMIRNAILGDSNNHGENDADFVEIYVGLTPLNKLFEMNFLQDSNWEQALHGQKKKFSELIKRQKDNLRLGVTTWADFAALLSRTMGSDAPMIAGCILLTSKVFDVTSDIHNQICEYDVKTGEVARIFFEKNYTDNTAEELRRLHDGTADNINF